MRIICVEEHVSNGAIADAVQQAYARNAPYVAAIGKRYRDDPDREPRDRPRFLDMARAAKLAAQPTGDRLAAMDAAGIAMQVVSLSNMPQLAGAADAERLCRQANDQLAAASAAHPDRFGAFFTLPWQDPDAAVREAERCVRDLGLRATLLTGRPGTGDAMVDDARYALILEALAGLEAPLYIHPGPPVPAVQQAYYAGFDAEVSGRLSLFGWGWHNEAGIQVIRLILSGALDRYRGLKIISGHWGEMVPFFLQRMDDMLPQGVTNLSRSITQTYREQVWVTPSGLLYLPHFQFIRALLGVERILFSVDYPFLTLSGARQWLEELPISEEERALIAHGNAEQLLRLGR